MAGYQDPRSHLRKAVEGIPDRDVSRLAVVRVLEAYREHDQRIGPRTAAAVSSFHPDHRTNGEWVEIALQALAGTANPEMSEAARQAAWADVAAVALMVVESRHRRGAWPYPDARGVEEKHG